MLISSGEDRGKSGKFSRPVGLGGMCRALELVAELFALCGDEDSFGRDKNGF